MKKIIITFTLLLSICLPSYSEIVHISMEKAVELAIENNLDIKSKRKRAEELQQEIKIANALKIRNFNQIF